MAGELVTQELQPQFHAVAVNGTEMIQASNGIQNWLRMKVQSIDNEIAETQAIYDSAVRNKWKSSTFKTQLQRHGQKRLYYSKLLAASEAGYTVVPNMEVSVFAIRVKRETPKWSGDAGKSQYSYSSAAPSVPVEEEQRLPIGEGRYESPLVAFSEDRHKQKEMKDGKEVEMYAVEQYCDGFQELEFPLAVAHPLVMDATARAMAMKIFDRIGVVPQTHQRGYRGDPIVLGQITRKEGWQTKTASFLIAWYLDPRTL
jgi:hypothetical protein